jgi:3-dehydroquinate synthase
MKTLSVELGERTYPITVGRDLDPALLERARGGRTAVALVDENVAALQPERVSAWLGDLPRLIIPSGEASKSLGHVERLARRLIEFGLSRDGLLISLGGGVTGDLCGFLAASYQRGIAFIQIPSTLLAQVDASVGGKVAVNLPGARNSLGFFLQPDAVIADLAFLDSLPEREMGAGLAELVKMAAIMDPVLLANLESAGADLLDPTDSRLSAMVLRSCELKAQVVAEDERETGLREILNFGHTLAHALEGSEPRPDLLHGEAVAIGMLAALRLGVAMGISATGLEERLAAVMAAWKLPRCAPGSPRVKELLRIMESDKKRRGGRVRFVLLESWGHCLRGQVPEAELLERVLADFLAPRNRENR